MHVTPHFIPEFGRANGEAHSRARYLATLAVHALIAETELTPKPALVDSRGPGAHADLSPALMRRSAHALQGEFELMALVSFHKVPSPELWEDLGAIGRSAERSMLLITQGINTHRGAIWALGLLVSAAAMGSNSPKTISRWAGRLAQLQDWNAQMQQSNGSSAVRRYHVSGARGEARAGFPHVITIGLPMLYRSRRQRASETSARLNALLAIMRSLDDTCLLHRGGLTALNAARSGAAAVLATGGAASVQGLKRLQQLDCDLTSLNVSPGGSADLLAATLFLDFLARSLEISETKALPRLPG